MGRIDTMRNDMKLLESDLFRAGDQELGYAVQQARREIDNIYISASGTFGVNHSDVRK
jgi:hypothetical protein